MRQRRPTGPIQVLHVFNAVRHSGAEQCFLSAVDEFAAHDVRFRLLAMAAPADSTLAEKYAERGVTVDHLPPQSWVRFAIDYLRHLRRVRPDVVHVHPERASVLTSTLPRFMGIPVVRSVHAGFDFPSGLRRRKRAERRIARWIGVRFVAVGPSPHANEWTAFANPAACIPNWYDPNRFRLATDADRRQARHHFGLPEDAHVVAVVGQCEAVKHHELLFDALAETASPERWWVLHAGTGPTETTEREHAHGLDLDGRVRFLGLTDEVPTVFAAADVHAMTSRREGLPIAVLEGLATGVATVVTDVPGLRELGRLATGVTVTAPDPSAVAQALERCLAHDGNADRVERSRLAAEQFGLAAGAAAYVAMYRGARRVDPIA